MTQFTLSLPLLALIAIFANAAFRYGNSQNMADAPTAFQIAAIKRASIRHKAQGLPVRCDTCPTSISTPSATNKTLHLAR